MAPVSTGDCCCHQNGGHDDDDNDDRAIGPSRGVVGTKVPAVVVRGSDTATNKGSEGWFPSAEATHGVRLG